jgi:hypothetical protein
MKNLLARISFATRAASIALACPGEPLFARILAAVQYLFTDPGSLTPRGQESFLTNMRASCKHPDGYFARVLSYDAEANMCSVMKLPAGSLTIMNHIMGISYMKAPSFPGEKVEMSKVTTFLKVEATPIPSLVQVSGSEVTVVF